MAELIISKRDTENETVLDLEGDLIFGDACGTLRKSLRDLILEGKINFVLNLSGIRYLDSCGIGELISALTAVNRENGQLTILNPTEKIQHLFMIAKLNSVFDIEYEEDQAAGN